MRSSITEMTDQQLQDFKARLQAQRVTGNGPDTAHYRHYRKTMLRKVKAELKRRGLPMHDGRVYAPAAQVAVQKTAA